MTHSSALCEGASVGMVACEGSGCSSPAASREGSWRRLALCGLTAVAAATLVAAPLLLRAGLGEPGNVELGQRVDKARLDKLSDTLLTGLQSSMDASIDSHVQQVMQAQRGSPTVPIPAMQGYHKLLPFDPHPYVTQTQLDRLLAEKRELEHKREAILRTLRLRREAAAAKAAKDAANLDRVRLQRAVTAAKKRQFEMAQQAARAAAQEMKQAAIAKEQAMNAAAVAEARQKQLAYMSAENEAQARQAAQMSDQEDAANDMQYQQDKSAVDTKLQAYLMQEKDLLHKISAAEKVAAHGGQWPAEGMPKSASPYLKQMGAHHTQLAAETASTHHQQALAQAPAGVQSALVSSLAKAVDNNKRAIREDSLEAAQLSSRSRSMLGRIQQLRADDARLAKEMIAAELKRVQH